MPTFNNKRKKVKYVNRLNKFKSLHIIDKTTYLTHLTS